MKVFVSGATGFIGSALCRNLAEKGAQVHALVRSESKAAELRHPNITLFQGDVADHKSLLRAMEGCQRAFHLAALTAVWTREKDLHHAINVGGTEQFLSAAQESGVKRVVITSTAGVMGPSPTPGALVDEDNSPGTYWATEYEITKRESERLAFSWQERGLEVVVVNPSRVYGPGPLTESNSLTRVVKMFIEGKWRFLPGDGRRMGNYVFIADVVEGHLLAMERGRSGERYILGGENISYHDFFETLQRVSGVRRRMMRLPMPLMLGMANLELFLARSIGKKPLIIPALVRKYTHDWNVSSEKARRELGYTITPLEEGLARTLGWLQLAGDDPRNQR